MSGTNPDGSHYIDPGIPDVSYFNGGDALHGFIRASYGFPQSLRLRRDALQRGRAGVSVHPDRHARRRSPDADGTRRPAPGRAAVADGE